MPFWLAWWYDSCWIHFQEKLSGYHTSHKVCYQNWWYYSADRPSSPFQKLTLAAKTTDNIRDVFKYELCSYPPALFNTSLLLREPQKPMLANAIWNLWHKILQKYLRWSRWWFPSPAHSMETRGYLWRYMYSVHRLSSKEVWGSNSCFWWLW